MNLIHSSMSYNDTMEDTQCVLIADSIRHVLYIMDWILAYGNEWKGQCGYKQNPFGKFHKINYNMSFE